MEQNISDIISENEPVRKSKILVVDDSMVDLELSTLMLEAKGYEVIAISTATQCMATIAEKKPDLVVLDIMMPEMDGNEALQLIRKKYTQLDLPVIIVTSKADASDVIQALKGGANDYVTKPVEFEVAFRRIETNLTIAKQSKTMVEAKEIESINAMITTYNHEINNPLTIALGNMGILKKRYSEDPEVIKAEGALWRIADIVKKTNMVLEKGSVEYEKYAGKGENKMLNLSNTK